MGDRSKSRKKTKLRGKPPSQRATRHPLIHPERTRRRGLSYYFHPKHHHPCQRGQGCWILNAVLEFQMFDEADRHNLSDKDGNLYNVSKDDDGEYRVIGCCYEQLARFWNAPAGMPWHGFPYWSIDSDDQTGRGDQARRPPLDAMENLVKRGGLSRAKAVRLRYLLFDIHAQFL